MILPNFVNGRVPVPALIIIYHIFILSASSVNRALSLDLFYPLYQTDDFSSSETTYITLLHLHHSAFLKNVNQT